MVPRAATEGSRMAYGEYRCLRVRLDRGVAFVTIDHPPINLLDVALMRELDGIGKELEGDDAVRVVVFDSADPDFFIAHADVALIRQLPTSAPRPTTLGFFHAMVERFRTMPKATIGKIDGRARGGGSEFLLSLDLRFGALGGEDVPAELAERWGYLNRALPSAELGPFVERLAFRIASFPADAIALAKAAVNAAELPTEQGLLEEAACFNGTLGTAAARQRMARFLELGGQTRAVELHLGSLVDRLAE